MKKAWETPKALVEEFEANEYVAACYTLVCAIPGSSATGYNDGTSPTWFSDSAPGSGVTPQRWTPSISWDGTYIHADGLLHGNCGNSSTSYDVNHSIGYEHNNDGTVKRATIDNVNIGNVYSGNVYYANWTSDNGYIRDYQHYGYAIMDSRPNHS